MEEESVDHRLSGNVGYGNGHGPTGITIDAGEEVTLAKREWEGAWTCEKRASGREKVEMGALVCL